MLAWFIRLFAHSCPTRRQMMATQDACDGLEARVDQIYDELKQLRGKVNAIRRYEKAGEDAPGETNGEDPDTPAPPKRFAPTAHLSQRFRRF